MTQELSSEADLIEFVAVAIHAASEDMRGDGIKVTWRKATDKAKEVNRVRAEAAIAAVRHAGKHFPMDTRRD